MARLSLRRGMWWLHINNRIEENKNLPMSFMQQLYGQIFLARNCYFSAHSLLFIYIKAEKTTLTSDFQYFFSAQRYLFLVIGQTMGAFAWQAYQAHHSFLFLNRYSSSCFLISSGISLETGHTTALANRSVNSERKAMSRSNCSMDITSIRS